MANGEQYTSGAEPFEDETTRYIREAAATMGAGEDARSLFLSVGNTLFPPRTHYPEFDEYVDLPPTNFIAPPDGRIILPYSKIVQSLRLLPPVNTKVVDRTQRELTLDEHGLAVVPMNRSGRLALAPGKDGFVATASLAGCTGVSAYAKRADGSTFQFTSHYGPTTQRVETPLNDQLRDFHRVVQESGELAGPAYCVIAYPEDELAIYESCAGKPFSHWRYTDQLKVTAGRVGAGIKVLVLPYIVMPGIGNSLAAGREGEHEGIFWNGAWVDPDNTY